MVINHNIQSMEIHRLNKLTHQSNDRVFTHLASALRINRAGDDASGLAVSEKMRSQARGLNRAAENTQDGISMIQAADGYLSDSTEVLQRIRELAVAASNGVYTSEDRFQIQVEVSQLIDELDRITSQAQFNAVNLFTGKFAAADTESNNINGSMWFHIGANMDQRERVYIGTMSAKALGLRDKNSGKLLEIGTQDKANAAIGSLDNALKRMIKQRAHLGVTQNKLETRTKGILSSFENITHAESRIRDADMAKETTDFVTNNTLISGSTTLLAKSHQIRKDVVQRMVLER